MKESDREYEMAYELASDIIDLRGFLLHLIGLSKIRSPSLIIVWYSWRRGEYSKGWNAQGFKGLTKPPKEARRTKI